MNNMQHPNPQSRELLYCHTCGQMTNHGIGTNGGCLKCRVPQSSEVEAIIHQFKSDYKLGGCFVTDSNKSKYWESWLRAALTIIAVEARAEETARRNEQIEMLLENNSKRDNIDFLLGYKMALLDVQVPTTSNLKQ